MRKNIIIFVLALMLIFTNIAVVNAEKELNLFSSTITIETPTSNVESGEVPYHTAVKISCASPEGYLAYSLNGGDFVYSYIRNKLFYLYEDTTITVKGWTDNVTSGIEYVTPEETYTYTVDMSRWADPLFYVIDAPEANIESGVVPYGTEVTLTRVSQYGHNMAYSLNGGSFIYSNKKNETIVITEDTVIMVKSWLSVIDRDNYFIEENSYVYTVTPTLEPTSTPDIDDVYPYKIKDISITNISDEVLSSVPNNTSFIIDMNLNKVKEHNSKDYLFVAVYDTDRALISIDYVKANFAVGNDYSFGFNIPAQDKNVGSIKAYVWSSFGEMKPLAETKTLDFTK